MLALVVTLSLLQQQAAPGAKSGSTHRSVPAARPPAATAIRAVRPPALDGRDADEVWRNAIPIQAFEEFEPDEGKAPRFATEAKVGYDARNFYVLVRAYDSEPAKIRRLLARRDVRTPSDQIKIIIDSYHDRRSGYEFAVNPAGVKRDYVIYDDQTEDEAWDGQWEVATSVDSLGWTAEFRIPLSQLRFPRAESHTFGFAVWRDIDRFKERVSWPRYHRNQAGLASQLGEVTGITGLSSPRRLEVSPYVVTRNVTVPTPGGYGRDQRLAGGLDFKYGITSNLTLDGTVNPDFGQVEADPAVLNLSAFETFFQEKRPFFMEGTGIFRAEVNCSVVSCGSDGLFYSRRIGRSPALAGLYGDARSPASTTILGATKLTGRLPGGLTLGVLDAVTQREWGPGGRTLEPAANYAVVRASQDFRKGETGIGAIVTSVSRWNDPWTKDSLRSGALAGGVDFRHRFLKSQYQIQGRIVGSRVTGTAVAIAATQRSAVHYYQRPDGALGYDSTRTSLTGDAEQLKFGRVGGGLIQFETSYLRSSPGLEVNDLGFLNRADQQQQGTWVGLNFRKPTRLYRQAYWNFNQWNEWTAGGGSLALDHAFNTNAHVGLKNNWWVHWGGTLGQLGGVYCDRCARGGPALRKSEAVSFWGGTNGDDRRMVAPSLWLNYWETDQGHSRSWGLDPGVDLRLSSRWSSSVGFHFSRNRDDRQWYGNFTDPDGVTHYTFAHLEQRTRSIRTRLNYTFTTNLTLQAYAEAFVSKGQYSSVRELADPRAATYANRFKPYEGAAVTGNPGAFNYKQLRSNLVLRWEYRPGSTLFLVWQQGRLDSESVYGARSFGEDLRQLFRARPDDTFLIKASYWLDW